MARYVLSLLPIFLALAGEFTGAAMAFPVAAAPQGAERQAPSLASDETLQEKVTVHATSRPLADVLASLPLTLKADLKASRQVADQRVTLQVTDQPLHHVMERLCGLLSHSPAAPRGYFWERLQTGPGQRPTYRLWRNSRSLSEEKAARNSAWQEALQTLKDRRNLARLSPEERKRYKSDLPAAVFARIDSDAYSQVLKGLTDAQLMDLMRGVEIPVDAAPLKSLVIAERTALWLRFRPDEPMPAIEVPARAVLKVARLDEDGELPNRSHLYGLAIQGIGLNGFRHISGGSTVVTPFPEADDPKKAPVYDLTPLLTGEQVSPEKRSNMGFTLQALAKVAGINLYQEHFHKPDDWGNPRSGIATLKGTLPQLLNAICQQWGYTVEKVGDDYVFWSRTWAQDRAADVSDGVLARWRKRLEQQGRFTEEDRMEMAATLTWPQVSETLRLLLPESGPWEMRREYLALRFLRRLAPTERAAASSEGGLSLGALDASKQAAMMRELDFEVYARLFGSGGEPSTEEWAGARVRLRVQNSGLRTVALEVRTNEGKKLWATARR